MEQAMNANPFTDEMLDKHLDAILKASGSSLKNYSFEKTKYAMRAALLGAIIEALEKTP
jgi:hypothetical protein